MWQITRLISQVHLKSDYHILVVFDLTFHKSHILCLFIHFYIEVFFDNCLQLKFRVDFSYIGNQLIELFRLELLDFSELVVDICKRLRFLFSIEAKSVLEFFESPLCVLVVHV